MSARENRIGCQVINLVVRSVHEVSRYTRINVMYEGLPKNNENFFLNRIFL